MNLLLSNDDGYLAPGLACLHEHLRALPFVSRIDVIAPDRDRSGASNSLTLDTPIRAVARGNGVVSVNGTPTDCVHLAITGLLETAPDIVIAGINTSSNLGDDVIYSGTVAAAMEGRFLGLPSIAVSMATAKPVQHYATAAQVVAELLATLRVSELPVNTILNINVPDLPRNQIKGLQATRLGHRHKAEPVIAMTDPRGHTIYWVGPPGEAVDAGPGTDFYAVNAGFVAITPLHVDLTRHSALPAVDAWIQQLQKNPGTNALQCQVS